MRHLTFILAWAATTCLYGAEPTPISVPATSSPAPVPIPAKADLDAARNEIKEVYEPEFAKASTSQQKTDLAKTLITTGIDTPKSASRYALLTAARGVAVKAGNIDVAFQAIEMTSTYFKIDKVADKKAVVESIFNAQKLTSKQKILFINAARRVLYEAVQADNYDVAMWAADQAVSLAKQTHDGVSVPEQERAQRVVQCLFEQYKAVVIANKTLLKQPADPESNLVVGRFCCFYKNDWDRGLPMLALGSDATLAKLAAKELKEVANPLEQADAWWALATKEKVTLAKENMKLRAIYWYEKTLPGLTGIDQDKAKRRIEPQPKGLAVLDVAPIAVVEKPNKEKPKVRPPVVVKQELPSIVGTYTGTTVLVAGRSAGHQSDAQITFNPDGTGHVIGSGGTWQASGTWQQRGNQIRFVYTNTSNGSLALQVVGTNQLVGLHTNSNGHVDRRWNVTKTGN